MSVLTAPLSTPPATFPLAHLSWSSVSLYSRCPACFYATYIERRPRRVSPALAIGSGLHGALAALRKGQNTVAAMGAAKDDFNRSLAGIDRLGELPSVDPILELGKWESWVLVEAEVERLVGEVTPIIDAETGYEILDVECELDFDGIFSVPFTGYADVIVRRDGVTTIKDAKSSASNTPPDALAWRQLATYSLAGGATAVGVDQVVKTKTVTVHPWTDPGYSGTVTGALQASVIEQVESVVAGVLRGGFPVGDPGKYGCDHEHPTVQLVSE